MKRHVLENIVSIPVKAICAEYTLLFCYDLIRLDIAHREAERVDMIRYTLDATKRRS